MSERFLLEWREAAGLRWLAWEGAGVAAVFPTRGGGVSPAPWETLDLGLLVGDESGRVLEVDVSPEGGGDSVTSQESQKTQVQNAVKVQ